MKKNKKKKKNKSFFPYMKRTNILILAAFFTGILSITATYAWFYASLDVRINMINMTVSDESGLYISLDGINYGSTIEVSKDTLFKDLSKTYPRHTSQWPGDGLYAVSTNGASTNNTPKFTIFGSALMYKDLTKNKHRIINTKLVNEGTNDYDGTIKSLRLGILKLDTRSKRSDINTIQTIGCNNKCLSVIYE